MTFGQWTEQTRMEWVATSLPISGDVKRFKMRRTCAVIFPSQNVLCDRCSGFRSIDLDHEPVLSKEDELGRMTENDADILVVNLKRPRDDTVVFC